LWTVQLIGIPLVPVVQDVILPSLVNSPDDATPYTQLFVQLDALILVARHVMFAKLLQL